MSIKIDLETPSDPKSDSSPCFPIFSMGFQKGPYRGPIGPKGAPLAQSLGLRSTGGGAGPWRLPRSGAGVGCRDGSQYVEGCWEFPYLKIRRFRVS